MLGSPRASSVFTPPCRAALGGTTAEEIRSLNIRATGRSLSAQALGIIPKIREVDLELDPDLQAFVREVHPEVIFAMLRSTGAGVAAPKKSVEGRGARLALLPPNYSRVALSATFRRSIAEPDDVVDALAALTVALRAADGQARSLPTGAKERDERGLLMEMVY